MMHSSLPVRLGVLLGFVFFAHALIPNSNGWPLIWPAMAGAASLITAARRGRIAGFGHGIGLAAKAGAAAGALFFVASALALWLLSTSALQPVAEQLGATAPIVMRPAVLFGLAFAALAGTLLAVLTGAAAYPFASRRQHGQPAP
jgi:hypothetical protein